MVTDIIRAAAGGELFEGHFIFGEGSGFIWEDVFDLTQFFIQIGSQRFGEDFVLFVNHIFVALDEPCLPKFDKLQGHQ